jgi:hypothetical protein
MAKRVPRNCLDCKATITERKRRFCPDCRLNRAAVHRHKDMMRERVRRQDPQVREAQRQAARVYRAKNPEKVRATNRRLYKERYYTYLYGFTREFILAKIAEQDGRCAICGVATHLHVDHDHESGEFRGMLCGKCNRGIGMFADSPERLIAAAEYVRTRERKPKAA